MLCREQIFPEATLPETAELIGDARALAREWPVVPGPFLRTHGVDSEWRYKKIQQQTGRIMQHAQIGFRDKAKSRRAWLEIFERCAENSVNVDRYGICLDWTMGLPASMRKDAPLGTGLLLDGVEDFVKLCEPAPVAPHFGDFVLGFPAAVENTRAALSAGATTIGNLGQYFTFRLPGWDDDIASTQATVTAIALIAAQDADVLVHSNLDDGFAAQFTDLTCVLGAVLLEQHIAGTLLGAQVTHCWGHHFTDPLRRLAFHLALADVSVSPGSMIYGNTVSYLGNDAQNYASLASYLSIDIVGQRIAPTGHAINPVPVSENERIPDISEIIDAQLFAGRLVELSENRPATTDIEQARKMAAEIVTGGRRFCHQVLSGLDAIGIDTHDAFAMLLALRRIGGRRLEREFGSGSKDRPGTSRRSPLVPSPLEEEITAVAAAQLSRVTADERKRLAEAGARVALATTDVHEHGKLALERVLRSLDVETVDAGVSVDPEPLAIIAISNSADAILLSTYNGIALNYFRALKSALSDRGSKLPVLIGGRLNQIPQSSNTSLPVDVTDQLRNEGAIVCAEIEDAATALLQIKERQQ